MEKFKSAPGIIPALDISLEKASELAKKLMKRADMITGLKIGSLLVMEHGLVKVCDNLNLGIPLILDMQKGATDIPHIVKQQVKIASECGVRAFIGAPLGAGSGSELQKEGTLEAFVHTCYECEMIPIIVLEMTQIGATCFLSDDACIKLAKIICDLGVPYVVAPANKPDRVRIYKKIFKEANADVEIISPGVGPQKTGDPIKDSSDAVKAGADHVVIGRAIYEAKNPLEITLKIGDEIQKAFKQRNKQ